MSKYIITILLLGFTFWSVFAKNIDAEGISKSEVETYLSKYEMDETNPKSPKYFSIDNKATKSAYFGLLTTNIPDTWDIQIFKLKNWYNINYNLTGEWLIWISFTNKKWKQINSNKVKWQISASIFWYSELVQYSDNRIIINPWWYHEWEWYELLYDATKNKLINIRTDIYKPLMQKKWMDNPIYDVKIRWNNLIIREYLYCCDTINDPNGNEEITINISKNKIIKKTKVKDSKARDGSRNN